ncbi:MAG: tyrosine-type recombinase/integrase [Ferrimicrobium sp.]
MAGSMRLVKEPDVWELRVYLGRDSRGKVKHRYVRFHGPKRAAERELARLTLAQYDQPQPIIEERSQWNGRTTVNEALVAWQHNGWDDLSPTTTRRYESLWRVHVKDSIGKERIASLSSYDVEKYLRKLKDQGLAEASVKQTRAMLARACRLARKWSGGQLPNPFAEAEMPSYGVGEDRRVRAPSVEEVQALTAHLGDFDLRFGVFIRVILATGMRRGEACGLRWNDVDFEGHSLIVDESVIASKESVDVKGPKTRASIRRVAVDPHTIEMLRDLRKVQEELARFTENELVESSFVFSFASGGAVPPYPDTFSHHFASLRESAGVEKDIHLHSLRHFQATVLDPVISERQKQARLGWSNPVMARHYTDIIAAEDHRAAQHIASVLDGHEH